MNIYRGENPMDRDSRKMIEEKMRRMVARNKELEKENERLEALIQQKQKTSWSNFFKKKI